MGASLLNPSPDSHTPRGDRYAMESGAVSPQSSQDAEDAEDAKLGSVTLVEVPGRANDIEEAVAAVGGPKAVTDAIVNKGKLRLRLCRRYQFQAPLPMKRHRTSDLLVKARKKEDGTWDYEAIAWVPTSFRTEVLADFLFVPGSELKHGEHSIIGSIEQEISGEGVSGAPYMPPAYFTRVDTPQAYDFEENSFLKRQRNPEVKAIAGTSEAKLYRDWVGVHIMKFNNKEPPTKPPEGAKDSLREDEKQIVAGLEKLFAERPLWLRGPAEERLKEMGLSANVSTMQKSFICVSYLWSDGPWRQVYIRLGFDPRTDPGTRFMQVIDFRDRLLKERRAYFERVQGTMDQQPVQALDCHFRTPPVNRSQLYQYLDIEDEVVQQILQSSEVLKECSFKTGWLPQQTLDAIRERMAVKAELLRRSRQHALQDATTPAVANEAASSQKKKRDAQAPEALKDEASGTRWWTC
ncbi:unnamed protein product [Durusdinium trenchii]|uniref:Transcription factor IIIC subunit 5 HTH domain-containing protein n=1 Tax=Durusdinium trenchii TaxID=1381693 RepID=A0ABP0MNU5_9DINO